MQHGGEGVLLRPAGGRTTKKGARWLTGRMVRLKGKSELIVSFTLRSILLVINGSFHVLREKDCMLSCCSHSNDARYLERITRGNRKVSTSTVIPKDLNSVGFDHQDPGPRSLAIFEILSITLPFCNTTEKKLSTSESIHTCR